MEAALRFLAERYAGTPSTPKRVGAALLNPQSGLVQGRTWYPKPEQDEIQDALDRLTEVARDLVNH